LVFRPPFQHRAVLKKLRTGTQNSNKNRKIGKQIITETHPQPRPEKRLRLGGVKTLKLTTLITLSAVFPKAQNSQSKTKKEPGWRLRAPKINNKLKKEHLKKQ